MSIADMTAKELLWQCAGGYDYPKCNDEWVKKATSSMKQLIAVREMTADECDEAARIEYLQCLQIHADLVDTKAKKKVALEALLSEVSDTQLPEDFKAVRDTALAKIRQCIKEECDLSWENRNRPVEQTGEQWHAGEIARLEIDAEYELEAAQHDYERNARYNDRLTRLMAALVVAE